MGAIVSNPEAIKKVKSDIALVFDTDKPTTSIQANKYVVWRNKLYMTNRAISTSDSFVPGDNIREVTDGVGNDLYNNIQTQTVPGVANTNCTILTNTIYRYKNIVVGSIAVYISDAFSSDYIATILAKPTATIPVRAIQNGQYVDTTIDWSTGRIAKGGLVSGYQANMFFAYITND